MLSTAPGMIPADRNPSSFSRVDFLSDALARPSRRAWSAGSNGPTNIRRQSEGFRHTIGWQV